MEPTKIPGISQSLEANFQWVIRLLNNRINSYFEGPEKAQFDSLPEFPEEFIYEETPLEQLIRDLDLGPEGRVVLNLALLPVVAPQALDLFCVKNEVLGRAFTEFGGIIGKVHSGFIPTAETALFALAGPNIYRRLELRSLFLPSHPLFRRRILQAPNPEMNEPEFAFPLILSPNAKDLILEGKDSKPDFRPDFPAKRMVTGLDWSDLILPTYTIKELEEIIVWLKSGDSLMDKWGLGRSLKPGFRALFFGPPGTGKTFAATLMGKATQKDVYRIDLSMMVSKWIGETEKNLAGIFDQAETQDWILFFDEADALFGKRTATSSSNDRYANQEVSYLLQRIEDFPGAILLASNFKTNIDKAFMRRFQAVIHFAPPDREERLRLWNNAFTTQTPIDNSVDFDYLADKYELTGGEIINVVRHAALKAYVSSPQVVTQKALLEGIRKEFQKEGRIFA